MKKSLCFIALFALCCVFLTQAGLSYAVDSFSENWDAYANDIDIITITDWVEVYTTSGSAKTTNTQTYSGTRSVKQTTTAALHSGHLINEDSKGSYEIFIRMNDGTQNYGAALFGSDYITYGHAFAFNFVYTNLEFFEPFAPCGWDTIDATALDLTWVDLKMIWRYVGTDLYIEPFVNSVSYGEQNCGVPADPITHITFYTNYSTADAIYFDDVIYDSDPYFPPEVFLTTPVSGSTITDDSTLLVGGWANIDSNIWTNIKIAFNDLQITETSGLVNVSITDNNGAFSIPLSSFNISNNGGWTLRAIVENNYEYNFDVPSPIYTLIFDIEGLPSPYAFTDFETWYTENVSHYEAPSAWALSMTGFLNPIFEKIGQFGDRINEYLDVSTAYEKGFQIGGVLPVIAAYVVKIDLFFGGFPLVQFFKWGILLMIGLFAIKIILKLLAFIPFVGGGG